MTTAFVLTPQAVISAGGKLFGGKFGHRVNPQHYAWRIKIAGVTPLKGSDRTLEWHEVGNSRQQPPRFPVAWSRVRTQDSSYLLLGSDFPQNIHDPHSRSNGFLDAGQSRVRARRF